MTIGDDDSKKTVLQWHRDRHEKEPTDREINSYGGDDEEENESHYDRDRYHGGLPAK